MTVTAGTYDWNERVAELFEATDRLAVARLLHRAISALIPLDSFIILHYHKTGIPAILYENTSKTKRQNNLENYLNGAYLLDPFYRNFAENNASGVVALKDIAPGHFLKSEYYGSYYKFSGLRDEVNIYIQLSATSSIALALGRIQGHPAFTGKDIRLLHDIQPLLRSLCRRHWHGEDHRSSEDDRGNLRFVQAMENFGKSCLSVKEGEVLHLLLMGHSAKSTAARMGISPGTVKIHRNNIYVKLDINSQTELFSLFIGALTEMTEMKGDGSQDPLIAYHQKKL